MELLIPALMAFLAVFGIARKVNIFEAFADGAKEGIRTVISIAPTLIGLLVAVGMVKASGLLDLITGALEPLCRAVGFPSELVPMAALRPISGSGATALLTSVYRDYGPDSFVGQCASVLSGSTETTFFAVTMYFSSVKVRHIRHTLVSALLADLTAAVMSVVTVRMLMNW